MRARRTTSLLVTLAMILAAIVERLDVIYPNSVALPPNVADLPQNW